jgi:hypothetical protein
MGANWDHGVPGIPYWEAILRVAKPGAHLVAFGGSRTYHRLACAIEDAGWEIRDTLMWLHGQGFPKSYNVSKGIDKKLGVARRVTGRVKGRGSNSGTGDYNWNNPNDDVDRTWYDETAPATDLAQQWSGYGTCLKPSFEPVILARKPLDGTIVNNIMRWGVGAFNIDDCRIELNGEIVPINQLEQWSGFGQVQRPDYAATQNTKGRWPANVILDAEVGAELDATVGNRPSCQSPSSADSPGSIFGGNRTQGNLPMDEGGPSRYYYCAKANRRDRDEGLPVKGNNHPTVKPTDLMRYLCRLITPPGATILDPFCGSGSTLKAALLEGFDCIGIEMDAQYEAIIRGRAAWAIANHG